MVTILLVSLGLVLAELLIFSVWIKYGLDKRMSFWDSFYFAFVSFTTIGFGNHGFYNGDNGNIGKVMFTLLIVILCLAPLALYINLVVRDVMTAATPFLARMGVTEPAECLSLPLIYWTSVVRWRHSHLVRSHQVSMSPTSSGHKTLICFWLVLKC
eukprot:sb/3473141/